MNTLKKQFEKYSESQILLILSAALIIIFTWIIMQNLWLFLFGGILGFFALIFFINKPKESFIILLLLRLVIDLLHWFPLNVAGFGLLEMFSGGSTLACIALILMRFKNHFERHPSIHLFLIWNLFLFFHLVFTPFSSTLLSEFFRIFSPVLIFAIASSYFIDEDDGPKMLRLFAYVGTIPLLTSLYYLATGQMNSPKMMVHGIKRLIGGYQNLRHAGLIMLIITNLGLLQFVSAYETKKKIATLFWAAYTGSAFLCLYLTQIRSSLLPSILGIGLFLFLTRRTKVLYILGGLTFIFILVSPQIQDRFKDIILIFTMNSDDAGEMNSLGSGRYGIWSGSWAEFQKRPILVRLIGLGYNGHVALTSATFLAFDKMSGQNYDPHNDFLFLLYNFGPIGMIAYVGMALHGIRSAIKVAWSGISKEHRDVGAICAAIMIGLLINNTMSNGTVKRVTVGWYFWVFGGIAFGTLKNYKTLYKNRQKKLNSKLNTPVQIPPSALPNPPH